MRGSQSSACSLLETLQLGPRPARARSSDKIQPKFRCWIVATYTVSCPRVALLSMRTPQRLRFLRVLQVDAAAYDDATDPESQVRMVNNAFRKLARKTHPDKRTDLSNAETFREIVGARDTLISWVMAEQDDEEQRRRQQQQQQEEQEEQQEQQEQRRSEARERMLARERRARDQAARLAKAKETERRRVIAAQRAARDATTTLLQEQRIRAIAGSRRKAEALARGAQSKVEGAAQQEASIEHEARAQSARAEAEAARRRDALARSHAEDAARRTAAYRSRMVMERREVGSSQEQEQEQDELGDDEQDDDSVTVSQRHQELVPPVQLKGSIFLSSADVLSMVLSSCMSSCLSLRKSSSTNPLKS
jgi:hypothetical protein